MCIRKKIIRTEQRDRIIGIDPGTRFTGIGVIDRMGNRLKFVHSETITTLTEKHLHQKLAIIFRRISAIVDEYKPDAASIEKVFHSVNPKSSLLLGHARGVSMLAVSLHQINIHEYAPNEVKSAVTGIGRAGKEQVSAMVHVLLNLDRTKKMKEDESDALAIAICHANTCDFSCRKMVKQEG